MKKYLIHISVLVILCVTLGVTLLYRTGSHADAVTNLNCTLVLPARPLSAAGLATPFVLKATNKNNGACSETNPAQAAFVQGVIFTPATSTVSIYNPLVITQGTVPAVMPTPPVLPVGATVALWFGFNGNILRLQGKSENTLNAAHCVSGLGRSLFGQVSYCNARAFMALALARVASPALGTALDGMTCPTVRDFSIVDQDQSDNVTTMYLSNSMGQTAQDTTANTALLTGAGTLANGSDNLLLTKVDAATGCTPFLAPDLANGGALTSAQPLNELSAAQHQAFPVALVPAGDPMVEVNGQANFTKRALYRIGVGQNPFVNASTVAYCANFLAIGPPRIALDMPLTALAPSLDAAVATNLYTFLAARANATNVLLNCGAPSPFLLTTNMNGVVTNAVLR